MADYPADSVPDAKPSSMLVRDGGKTSDAVFDVLVIGAGPTGLACAIEAQKAGFSVVLVDKGCVCNSLFHYPSHMTFFTTPELLEIGNIPFPSPNPKPTRNEALQYYRLVAAHYKLDVRQYERVERVTGADGAFTVHTEDRFGRPGEIEGAQADRFHRLLRSAELYGNSRRGLEQGASLLQRSSSLLRHGCGGDRRQELGGHCGAGVVAERCARDAGVSRRRGSAACEVLDQAGHRKSHQERRDQGVLQHKGGEITPDAVVIETPEGLKTIKNDFVFAMTGYHPDFSFLESMGVRFEGPDRAAGLQCRRRWRATCPGFTWLA